MSFSIKEAKMQYNERIRGAIANNDDVTLYHLADLAQQDEEYEHAEKLLKLARNAQAQHDDEETHKAVIGAHLKTTHG